MMRRLWRILAAKPPVLAAVAFSLGVLSVLVIWGGVTIATLQSNPLAGASVDPTASDAGRTATASPQPTRSVSPTPTASRPAAPGGASIDCPDPTVEVATAAELADALGDAAPGAVIVMADGTYTGNFVARVSGEAGRPITLCGGAGAVLDGGDVEDGYVFHLDGASHWQLLGFTVTNGQKGVMADGTVGSTIEGLTVHFIGDEAIHLRRHSTDNVVRGNTVGDTGHRREKFGEGIYIGTAESNWCDISDCRPDNSDRNLIEDNTIADTTSESIDAKEGTTGGVIRGNRFDGSRIVGADSWVDVKGNDWRVEQNTGVDSPLDGFQTHEILDGWGTRNVFSGNTAEVNGPGFGYSLTPVRDNVVTCDNTATNAGEGLANTPCSG
jgi:hypothetical protein